jgi:general secretion pathway protein E
MDVDGNMTFSRAMRSSLRLDPDVIMVGEIRDEESADIAQKAGTSGHMVLSTVHANSAAETITRLLAFGLKGFEISSVLSAMIAQRLVRKFDDECLLQWAPPNDVEREWLTKRNLYSKDLLFPTIVEGKLSTRKRIPLVEMIEVTPEIRAVLESDATTSSAWVPQIVNLASQQEQFETLAQAGVRIALQGDTTLEEVMRASSEVAFVPEKLRWDQVLVLDGHIKVEAMEKIRRLIQEERALGNIIRLQDQLIESSACKPESILAAMRSPKCHPCFSTPPAIFPSAAHITPKFATKAPAHAH